MAINHVNDVASMISTTTAVPVKPNEETINSNKKQVIHMKKIRLQHPQQQGKEFEVELVNDDDKIVCDMCKNSTSIFEKMKSLYKHMKKAHSDVEWKKYLNAKLLADIINKEAKEKKKKKKKVVIVDDSISVMAPAVGWGLTRKRSASPVDDGGVNVKKVYKIQKIEGHFGLTGEFSPDEFEAAEALLLLSQPTKKKEIQEEAAKESEGFKFDLNQPPPPMDMEEEAAYL